jgi:GNAT superfamily N-acetyltransferase
LIQPGPAFSGPLETPFRGGGQDESDPPDESNRLMNREIRRAEPADANTLTTLCMKSKAHWGYDAAFMAKIESSFVITADYILNWPVYVLLEGSTAIGFYGFRDVDNQPFLCDIWLVPSHIGKGLGKLLWLHALETARSAGYDHFLIESDPNAEGFYLGMGANCIGSIKSEASGRTLPLLEMQVRAE